MRVFPTWLVDISLPHDVNPELGQSIGSRHRVCAKAPPGAHGGFITWDDSVRSLTYEEVYVVLEVLNGMRSIVHLRDKI